jgi:hypothetical protein
MRKVLFWATVASGAVAAYLMLKKGEPVGQVARQVLTHPIGSLVDQVRSA